MGPISDLENHAFRFIVGDDTGNNSFEQDSNYDELTQNQGEKPPEPESPSIPSRTPEKSTPRNESSSCTTKSGTSQNLPSSSSSSLSSSSSPSSPSPPKDSKNSKSHIPAKDPVLVPPFITVDRNIDPRIGREQRSSSF